MLLAPLFFLSFFCGETIGVKDGQEKVMVIRLSDDHKFMVDKVQSKFIIKSLDRAESEQYDRVILMIDTYGGVVFSARDISERLLRLHIPSVAYVETKAISAGAFIAYACDTIVMEKNTTIGDAQVIMSSPEGKMEVAPEKIVSVYRSDWKKSCDAKGRSFALAQGFFDESIEVLLVGRDQHQEFTLRSDYEQLEKKDTLPLIKIIKKKGQLLTLHADEAASLGIVEIAQNIDEYLGKIDTEIAPVFVDMTWREQTLRLLGSNGWVFVLLVLIGLYGIYMEVKLPGLGIPGFTAVVCFTLVFASRYLLGTADFFDIILFIVGIALCLFEIFVTPGVGVVGITGLLLLFSSLILASIPDFSGFPTTDLELRWIGDLSLKLVTSIVFSTVAFFALMPYITRLQYVKRFLSPVEFKSEHGYVMDTTSSLRQCVGEQGVAEGDLHPVGKVRLDSGELIDVISEGFFIEAGDIVEIDRIDGNRIIVRKKEEEHA